MWGSMRDGFRRLSWRASERRPSGRGHLLESAFAQLEMESGGAFLGDIADTDFDMSLAAASPEGFAQKSTDAAESYSDDLAANHTAASHCHWDKMDETSAVAPEDMMTVNVLRITGDHLAALQLPASETAGGLLQRLFSVVPAASKYACKLALGHGTLLRSASLQQCGVRDGSDLYLVQAQSHVDVNLSDNRLGSSGLMSFAAALREDAPLRSLALDSCCLEGSEGGQAVAAVLKRVLGLEDLRLDGNNGFGAVTLGADGLDVAALSAALPARIPLRSLSLGNCSLHGVAGGKGVAGLLRCAPHLEVLDLCGNNGLAAGGLQALAQELQQNTALRLLDLGDCGLKGGLGGNSVGALTAVAPLLEYLGLGKNALFGHEGLAALTEVLVSNTSLTHLDIGDCGLEGQVGRQAVSQLTRRVKTLLQLNLRGMDSLDVAEALQASDADALHGSCARSRISAGLCVLTGGAGMGLAVTSVAAAYHQAGSGLRHLDLRGCAGLDHAGLLALADEISPHLQSLNLSHCMLQGGAGGRLAATIAGRALALERLNLTGNVELGTEGLAALCADTGDVMRLEILDLSECGLEGNAGGTAVASFACRSAASLQQLHLTSNYRLGAAGIHAAAAGCRGLPSLKLLSLGVCGLQGGDGRDAVASFLSHTPLLEFLDISGNRWEPECILAVVEDLAPTTKLTALNIGRCAFMGAEGGRIVAKITQQLPSLRTLKLRGNHDFCATGLLTLASELASDLDLRSLDLHDCGLEGSEAGKAAAAAVSRVCMGATSLHS